ncbi:hypothetical protein PMIN05_003823 [Paraphaeosphaeria minitans]
MTKPNRNNKNPNCRIQIYNMETTYPPMAFNQLSQFLASGLTSRDGTAQLSQIRAAAHFLGIQKSPFIIHEIDAQLQNALMVGTDMEWYESGPKRITEVGISVLPVLQGPLSKPIHALNNMEVHHIRLKNTAHMINGEKCPGHPEEFEFGSTCFVDLQEAKQAFTEAFIQHDAYGNPRPIILCGHAIDNDLDILRKNFEIDLEAWDVIVLVLDTQAMAKELGMNPSHLMSLKSILEQYCVEEKYLHNAGNDIAQTMVAASLLAGEVTTGRGRYSPVNQIDVDNLKAMMRNRNTFSWGTPLFCTNCDSTEHLVGQCPKTYICTRCAYRASWKHMAHTHPVGKCVRPPFPCKDCIESTNKSRQRDAMTHYIEDCHLEKLRKIKSPPHEMVYSMRLLLV